MKCNYKQLMAGGVTADMTSNTWLCYLQLLLVFVRQCQVLRQMHRSL
jgi:hypothetical protein